MTEILEFTYARCEKCMEHHQTRYKGHRHARRKQTRRVATARDDENHHNRIVLDEKCLADAMDEEL